MTTNWHVLVYVVQKCTNTIEIYCYNVFGSICLDIDKFFEFGAVFATRKHAYKLYNLPWYENTNTDCRKFLLLKEL